jgi:hypothetical protein
MANALKDFFNDGPLRFRGEPKDALRSLCFIGLGLGLCLLSLGMLWLMTFFSVVSGKGILVVVIGPLAGGICCVIGVLRFLLTTLRFRMYLSLLLFGIIGTGVAYGIHYGIQSRRIKAARRDAIRAAFKDEKVLRSLVEIRDLQKAEGSPYLKGKLVVLLDEETDYNGFPPPMLLRDPVFLREQPVEKKMRAHMAGWHDLLFELPVALQATTPEEVTTVVWIKGIKQVVGVYKNTGRSEAWLEDFPDHAYKYHATVTVIDRTVPAVVAVQAFVGPDPPEKKSASGDNGGSLPAREICNFLENLPRR